MKSANENNIRVLKGFPPHIKHEFGINKNSPTFMSIHMKPICNFRCKKCFVGEQKNLSGYSETLSVDEIKAILKNAGLSGVKVLGISGAGEPFLDKRIIQVIEEANKLDFIIHIPTNASMLTEEIVTFLLANNVTLVLSFDTTNPKRFAEKTNTDEEMYNTVSENILMAQKIYKDTKITKTVNGKTIEIYRIAIHMTVQKGEVDEIKKVKQFISPDTLFSVSPVADAGFAKNHDISEEIPESDINEMSEKHIVICKDEDNQKDLCGFFRFGLDMNFDGQLLLDAHAMETRNMFKNIRDFNYQVSAAYDYLEYDKKEFINNCIDGFCPVRSHKLSEWIAEYKTPSKN